MKFTRKSALSGAVLLASALSLSSALANTFDNSATNTISIDTPYPGELYVGLNNPDNTLIINSNVTVTAGELILGNSESSTNNLLSLDTGSLMVVGTTETNGISTGGIIVGDADGAAAIRIDNNSSLEGEYLYMGVATNNSGKISLLGEGSSIEIAQDATIGLEGDDSLLTIGSGTAMNVGGDLTVGDTGSNNLVNVSGSLFVNETNNIVVGTDAENEIRINSGGTLQVGGDVESGTLSDLGVEMKTGSTLELGGALTLTKNRIDDRHHVILNNDLSANTASWNSSSLTAIGKTSSNNSLTFTNGATGTAGVIQIGQNSGANNNELNIGGSGSTLTLNGDLTIGNSGANNEMNISDGAQVDANAALYVGKNSSASGNAVNVGSNSTLNVLSSTIYIGDSGANSKLTITDGSVNANKIILGNNSTGNRLTASGSNAQVNVTGDFIIGSEAGSAAATIRNTTDTDGSWAALSDGATMDVQNLTVGKNGSGSILTIRDEAVVNASGSAVIGENSGDNYIFLEEGSNAQFNVGGDLTVGSDGDAGDNRFAVYGGTAEIGGDLLVGANTNQHDLTNYIHLQTTNAVLNVANAIRLGSVSSDNTLTLAEGATATTADLLIGTYESSSNNIVTVKGEDSLLTVSGSLEIGSTNSGGNSVVLQDGGTLDIAQENISIGSTNDYLTVADGGILKTLGWDFGAQTNLSTNIVFESGSTLHMFGSLSGTNMIEGGLNAILDGAGADWDTGTNSLYVGYETDSNSLTLTNGATASTATNLYIGYASAYNTLTVGGTASTLDIGADLFIGTETNTSTANMLEVLSGGMVNIGGDAFLYNEGMLKIDSTSQVNVTGDYEQDATSTLDIGISSNQVNPNLVVGGNAEFASTTDSENNPVIRIFDEGIEESNVVTIVQADTITIGGETASSGKFESNIHSNVLLGFTVLVTNDVDNTYIILSDFLKQSIADGGGLEGQLLDVSNEIEAMADAGDTNAQEMVATIRSELSTEEEINTAFENIYGEKISSIPAHNVINVGVQSVNEQLFMRSDTTRSRAEQTTPEGAAGPHAAEQELQGWISGFGSWADKSVADGFTGYDSSVGGFMVGADMSVAPNVLVGLAGGKGSATVDKDNGASADTKSIYAALYSSIGTEAWFGDFSLIYAGSSVDADIESMFDTQAEYDAQNVAFSLGGGKEIIGKYMIFTPQLSFLGNFYSQDAYTETSNGSVTRDVDSFSAFYLQSALGGSAAMYTSMGNVTFKPEVRVHWMHEWLGDDEDLDFKLTGGANNYTMQLQAPEKDIFKIGIGSSAKIGEYLELRADFDMRFGKDYSDQTLLGSIRYQF